MKIGLNRKIATIEVQDKVFKIGIFPIMCESLIVKHDLMEKEFEKLTEPTADDVNEKNLAQYEMQFDILESLLIANGYDFDRSWWEMNTDMMGVSEFIILSKSKDIIPEKLKKKETIGHSVA